MKREIEVKKYYENEIKTDRKLWKFLTCNERALAFKENELIDEFVDVDMKIVGITETKNKGKFFCKEAFT